MQHRCISIHAAREGGDAKLHGIRAEQLISIHAAREGGDGDSAGCSVCPFRFQSTPPVKAATCSGWIPCTQNGRFQSTPPVKAATPPFFVYALYVLISIHAAREGGDKVAYILLHITQISIHAAREGGDVICKAAEKLGVISIHAAREGGDDFLRDNKNFVQKFQSTPPVKAAT